MIVGKQNIIAWFENLNVPYWRLFAKGQVEKGTPIAQGSEADNASTTDALESLKQVLALQDRGQFTLLAGDNPSVARRGNFKIDFEIPSSSGAVPATTQPVMSGLPQSIGELDDYATKRAELLTRHIKMEMQIENLEKENKELKQDIKELEKEANPGMAKFWDAINGIGVDKIIGALLKPAAAATPAVTGVAEATAPPETDPTWQRLAEVIKIFQEADPDWLGTLEKMAAKIKEDPSVITMFKKFL